MKLTTNYSLKKPDGSDVVNIDDFNYNADTIDVKLKEANDSISENKTSILTNTNNISNLTIKVNNGQNSKLTDDEGKLDDITGKDINDYKHTCFLKGEDVKNAPKDDPYTWYTFESYSDGTWGHQIATAWFSNKRYIRCLSNGTWGDWRELYNDLTIKKSEELILLNGFKQVFQGTDKPVIAKTGNICTLQINATNNSNTSVGTTIVTLPDEYLPKNHTRAVAFSTDGKVYALDISGSYVNIYTEFVANSNIRINTCWEV